jgi:hypothetical protein
MSSVFQGLTNAAGRIKNGAGPITQYFRGLPLNAAGEVVSGQGPVVGISQGMPFNAAGEIVGIQASAPSGYGPGATPYGPNGELEIAQVASPVATVYQGAPYNVDGLYCVSTVGGTTVIVSKDFTLTPAQVSSTTIGYRLSPLSGTLAPDNTYAGGAIDLMLAQDSDEFYISTQTNAQFPGIAGNLAVQIGPYVGPGRLILSWDGFDRYIGSQPGIYTYLQDQLALATSLRLSGAPA